MSSLLEGQEHKILKNSDGIYKVQVKKYGDTYYDVTYNDTATAIAGRGNPTTQLFFSRKDAEMFIAKHFTKLEPRKEFEAPVIKQDWKEL